MLVEMLLERGSLGAAVPSLLGSTRDQDFKNDPLEVESLHLGSSPLSICSDTNTFCNQRRYTNDLAMEGFRLLLECQ